MKWNILDLPGVPWQTGDIYIFRNELMSFYQRIEKSKNIAVPKNIGTNFVEFSC